MVVMHFDAEGWYTEEALRARYDLDARVLRRAREEEGLACKQVGGRRWYKGQWLLAWLEAGKTGSADGDRSDPA